MHRENNPYICPYNSCGLIVKLKDFNQHTLDLSLSIHVEGATPPKLNLYLHGVHHVILRGVHHVRRFWSYVVYTT